MRSYWAMVLISSLIVFTSSPSPAQQRSCKAALNYCLQHFVRPGTDDAAQCRAAYAQAIRAGYWPAHPSTNSPGFPCRAR